MFEATAEGFTPEAASRSDRRAGLPRGSLAQRHTSVEGPLRGRDIPAGSPQRLFIIDLKGSLF